MERRRTPPPSSARFGETGAFQRPVKPWQQLARVLLLSSWLVALVSCADPEEELVRFTVGCSWPETAAEMLRQELEPLAADLGIDVLHVKTFSEATLRDFLFRRTAGVRDEGLDMAIVPNHMLGQLDDRGLLAEVPLAQAERLATLMLAPAWDAVNQGSRAVAVPVGSEVVALVYNPTLIDGPPRSLGDLASVRSRHPGVYPFSMDIEDPLSIAGYAMAGQHDGTRNGPDRLRVPVHDLSRLIDRILARLDQPTEWRLLRGAPLESMQIQLFAEGRLAAFLARPWLLGALEMMGVPLAVIPSPPIDAGDGQVRQLVSYQCIVVRADSPWVDLAFRLSERMSVEEVHQRLTTGTRHLPVLISSYRLGPPMRSDARLGFLRALEQGLTFPSSAQWDDGLRGLQEALQMEVTVRLQQRRTLAGRPRSSAP